MAYEFRLPQESGLPDKEGVVVNWFKEEGHPVAAGELLLEVQFEKITFEVHAPVSGVLSKILCARGDVVRVGQPLCLIEEAQISGAPGSVAEIRATPAARRLARELSVDISKVPGTGPGGRITEDDVKAFANAADVTGPGGDAVKRVPLTPIQKTVGRRMLESLREAAQFTVGREVNVTPLTEFRAQLKQTGSAVTLTDLVHRAVVLALADYPELQAVLDGDHMVIPSAVHLGFAVARGNDLLVPVIRNAQKLSLDQLASERRRLTRAVLNEEAAPSDLQPGTFTVSNLGTLGVDFFTPVLYLPQVAILGVGRILDRATIEGTEVRLTRSLTLSLTVDHRLINGALAARFLARLSELLAEPWKL
ncbi:MAG: dihydrolipoamide acetyltransferase family protein [Bacillota bacterium]